MTSNAIGNRESFPQFYFPKVLIGDAYKEVMLNLPEEPTLPAKEVAKDERRGPLTFSTVLVIIIVVIVLIRPDLFDNSIGFIGLLLCYKFLRTAVESSEYESNVRKADASNAVAFAKYEEEMQEYQPFLEFKNAVIADTKEGGGLSKNSVLSNLHKLKNITISNTTGVKLGVSENKFLFYLKLTFGEKIKRGVVVSTSTGFECYFPDFVYYDDLRKIYVDIEIDEPYDLQTGKPIHCSYDDIIRNDFFVDNFWCVIRFSEKQVVKEPENCIKTIQSIIKSLEDCTLDWSSYVTEDLSWDEATALQFEKQGYREKYLGIDKRDRITTPKRFNPFEDDLSPRILHSGDDLPF